MWGSRRGEKDRVTCLACGRELERSDAREYDKEGDRWTRRGKEFEYVCKPCHRELSHQPRDELEALLVDIEGEESVDQEEFLRRYVKRVQERYDSLEDPGN